MIDNKWQQGKVQFVLPPVSPEILARPGLKPVIAILDENIGNETLLLVTEPRANVENFNGMNLTRLNMKAGIINTSFGPVSWLLFYFTDPSGQIEVAYENTINMNDPEQVLLFKQLAQQRFWHMVIADDTGDVVNFFEFPNTYGLEETLIQFGEFCENSPGIDFMSAKKEYEERYSIENLLEV